MNNMPSTFAATVAQHHHRRHHQHPYYYYNSLIINPTSKTLFRRRGPLPASTIVAVTDVPNALYSTTTTTISSSSLSFVWKRQGRRKVDDWYQRDNRFQSTMKIRHPDASSILTWLMRRQQQQRYFSSSSSSSSNDAITFNSSSTSPQPTILPGKDTATMKTPTNPRSSSALLNSILSKIDLTTTPKTTTEDPCRSPIHPSSTSQISDWDADVLGTSTTKATTAVLQDTVPKGIDTLGDSAVVNTEGEDRILQERIQEVNEIDRKSVV